VITFTVAPTLIGILAAPIGGISSSHRSRSPKTWAYIWRVSLLSGFILSLPVLLYELMAFIAPGLTAVERRWTYIFIPFATVMFVAGVAFTYFIMLPVAVPFLIGMLNIPTNPRPSSYVDFVTTLMFWLGISFEMPIVVFLLAKLKLVSARMLARAWRYAIVIIAYRRRRHHPHRRPRQHAPADGAPFLIYFFSILMAAIARR